MTKEELKVTYKALMDEGYTKEELFCATCQMFLDDQMSITELRDNVRALGYVIDESILSLEVEAQESVVYGYIKSFAIEYNLERFKEKGDK